LANDFENILVVIGTVLAKIHIPEIQFSGPGMILDIEMAKDNAYVLED
jgi:hypothetical protein